MVHIDEDLHQKIKDKLNTIDAELIDYKLHLGGAIIYYYRCNNGSLHANPIGWILSEMGEVCKCLQYRI
jgi:hypothetical protein